MKKLSAALLSLVLVLGLVPTAFALEGSEITTVEEQGEQLMVGISAAQPMQGAKIVVSAYSNEDQFVSCSCSSTDLAAGSNSVPVDKPAGGAYYKVFFLDGAWQPVSDEKTVDPAGSVTPVPSGFRFVRSTLTEEEQAAYDALVKGLYEQASEIEIDRLPAYVDTEEAVEPFLKKIVEAVDHDYPEYFWYTGTKPGMMTLTMEGDGETSRPVSILFKPGPGYVIKDPDERARLQGVIDAWEAACLKDIPEDASDYEKALRVYRYIVATTDYTLEEFNSLDHVAEGHGMCGCYSKAAQYLLNRMGVDCTYVNGPLYTWNDSGERSAQAHAWNLVWLDGTPCWMDVTSGDPITHQFDDSGAPILDDEGNPVKIPNFLPEYAYFGITTAELEKNHEIDPAAAATLESAGINCVSEEYNYYKRNGLYIENDSDEVIVEVMAKELTAGEERISLRFADEIAADAYDRLFDNNGEVLIDLLQQAVEKSGRQIEWSTVDLSMDNVFATMNIKLI